MLGERLKLARKRAGFSLRGLSAALDGAVSPQAIGKYERGEMMPSSGVLSAIARTLGVSLDFLMSDRVDTLEEVEFRKLSRTSAKDQAHVKAAVIDKLQRYLTIEEILELNSDAWHAPGCNDRFVGIADEGEVLADDLREEWALGIDPIPNMTSLLEDRSIKVLVMPLPHGVSGLTCLVSLPDRESKVHVIVVNQHITLERRRFTLAHELGHRLIDHTSPVDHEKTSNIFAGAFLVPRAHLVHEIGKRRNALGYKELIHLKRMYRVSAGALLVRLRQIGVINDATLTRAFKTFARSWRSNEPAPLESAGTEGKTELPRRFERLCYWALAEKLIAPPKASELLREPLAEIEKGLKGPAEANADHRE